MGSTTDLWARTLWRIFWRTFWRTPPIHLRFRWWIPLVQKCSGPKMQWSKNAVVQKCSDYYWHPICGRSQNLPQNLPHFFSEPLNRLFRAPLEIGFGDSDRSRSSDSEHALMSLRSLVVLEKSSRQNPLASWQWIEKWRKKFTCVRSDTCCVRSDTLFLRAPKSTFPSTCGNRIRRFG